MSELVSVILVNYNNSNDTIECIKSLMNITFSNFRIIIVDNNSNKTDINSLSEFINTFSHKISLYINKENLGFAGACNIGIVKGICEGADYILLLNNDTIVESNFLSEMLSVYSKNPKFSGIVVPKICYYEKSDRIWYAGGYISKLRATGVHKGLNKPTSKFNRAEFVSFASGCCMLIPKTIITEVGFLDEKYFLYQEDVDYSIRLIRNNYDILYLHSSVIYHKIGSSSKESPGLISLYYNTRNRLYISQKYFKNYFFITYVLLLLSFIGKAVYWFIIKQQGKVKTVIKSYCDFNSGIKGKVNFN